MYLIDENDFPIPVEIVDQDGKPLSEEKLKLLSELKSSLEIKQCPYCKNGFKAHYDIICLNKECNKKCDCEVNI